MNSMIYAIDVVGPKPSRVAELGLSLCVAFVRIDIGSKATMVVELKSFVVTVFSLKKTTIKQLNAQSLVELKRVRLLCV